MKQKLLFAVMLLCMATGFAKAQVVTALVDGDEYFIQNANTTLSERNLYWDNNNLRTRSDATPLSVIFKAHEVEEGGQTYWTFEITSSNYKGYYLGRTNDNGANARAVDTNQKYLWTVSYVTSDGTEGSGFKLILKGEEDQERRALMMNGSANWVCAYYDETNDKTANTSHWIFTKVACAQAVQQPSNDYIVNVTTDYLGEADNFSDNGESTRFRSSKYWTVENFDVDCGGDGHKQGIDRHPGYNCLQLGTWDQNGNAQDNSRLYKEVTLPAGKYYFGAKYHAIESGAYDNDFLFVTTTNPSNSLTKDNIQNSLAYAPMAGSAGGDNYYGIYFELDAQTTIYLGWLANSSVWHSEFRASGITLRKTADNPGVQEAQQLLSTYATDLTIDKLVQANGFTASSIGSRYGTPANWTVEDYQLGEKNGIDNYPGYNCLQLGRWEENTTSSNMANSRLYRQMTLQVGRYYFGAMYQSLPNESKQNTFMFATTNAQSLTIGNVYDNALACARMDNAGGGNYYGIYFELTAETTLYLGWLTNSTVQYSEFRVSDVTLRTIGSDQGVLTSPWTQLTEMPSAANIGNYFFVLKDYPRALTLVSKDASNNQGGSGKKSMWYTAGVDPGTNKDALWSFYTFEDNQKEYQIMTSVTTPDKNYQMEWNQSALFRTNDNANGNLYWGKAKYTLTDLGWTIQNGNYNDYLGPWSDNFENDAELAFNKTGASIGHFDLFAINRGTYVSNYENYASASLEHPVDLTYILDNPGAERQNTNNNEKHIPRGWKIAEGSESDWETKNNGDLSGKVGTFYFQQWGGDGKIVNLYQEFTGLPTGFYRFSAIVSTWSENVSIYANSDETTVTPNVNNGERIHVIAQVTDGNLRVGVKGVAMTNNWLAFDAVQLEYIYLNEPQTVIGQPTWSITDGQILESISTVTVTYPDATTNVSGKSFAILDNSAVATLTATGETTVNGTLSLDNNTITINFGSVTLVPGKEYTITLPAGAVGFAGETPTNEATSITFKVPYIASGNYYLRNVKTDDFIERRGDEVYTTFFGEQITWTNEANGGTIKFTDGGQEYYIGGHWYARTDGSQGNAISYWELVPDNGAYKLKLYNVVDAGYDYFYANNDHVAVNGKFGDNIPAEDNGSWQFMTQAEYDAYVTTISEDLTAAPATTGQQKVALTRTLKGGQWNGFSVPFSFTVAGSALDGAEVKQFSSVTDNEITLADATDIVAGEPYLVKPATDDIANPTFRDVTTWNTTEVTKRTTDTDNYTFQAHLFATDLATDGSVAYISTTDSSIKKLQGDGAKIKGLRSIFNIPVPTPSNPVKALVLKFDDDATAIMDLEGNITEGAIYNLAGQRMSAPQRSAQGDASHLKKGIYIQNGKKVLVK